MNFEGLPFVIVAANGKVTDTWRAQPTGSYVDDCATGRQYFRMLQMVMHTTRNPLLLVRVIEGQAAKYARWSGIETGFHSAMADELTVD